MLFTFLCSRWMLKVWITANTSLPPSILRFSCFSLFSSDECHLELWAVNRSQVRIKSKLESTLNHPLIIFFNDTHFRRQKHMLWWRKDKFEGQSFSFWKFMFVIWWSTEYIWPAIITEDTSTSLSTQLICYRNPFQPISQYGSGWFGTGSELSDHLWHFSDRPCHFSDHPFNLCASFISHVSYTQTSCSWNQLINRRSGSILKHQKVNASFVQHFLLMRLSKIWTQHEIVLLTAREVLGY